MALVDGAGFGTIDIANQTVEKEIGLRETLDPVRTGTVALTAVRFRILCWCWWWIRR
jgi:hypothetical protein